MLDAYYAYSRWGAKAKVEDLEKHYAKLLNPILQREKFVSILLKRSLTRLVILYLTLAVKTLSLLIAQTFQMF